MTPEREKKIQEVEAARFRDVVLVVENVDDPHNLGAILRSSDAVGVGEVHLLYTNGKAPRMAELRSEAAASAAKWLKLTRWTSVDECVTVLRNCKMQILVTALSEKGKPQWNFDFKKPTAIVVGNEHDGASPEIISAADGIITIPMRGMVQSLNVSVAAAVVLEDVLRQRVSVK